MPQPVALVIDENPETLSRLIRAVRCAGPGIVKAHSFTEGYAKAVEMFPDIIILGLPMDNTHGTALLKQIQAGEATSEIPVVLVGEEGSDHRISKGFRFGARVYMDRSSIGTMLTETVARLLTADKKNPKKTLLVVEDSTSVRRALFQGLSNEGYEVKTASNGRKALDILSGFRPDLILSDIYMPEMDGFQLCEALSHSPLLSTIPIVVMSTENDAGHMKRMMQYGAASYIVKPFNIEQLILVLNKIFSFQFDLLLKERERLNTEHRFLISSITSLVQALEARDSYTRGHSERVAKILSGMVRAAGGSRQDAARAMMGGQLHDIGKIGVRDNILLKKEGLSPDEFDRIKEHPVIGTTILEPISSLRDILPIVTFHHERIDGKGYPRGLKGSEIPLLARMAAVADTYDALTSNRPYRNSMPGEKAKQILLDAKGSQLCGECTDLFLNQVVHTLVFSSQCPNSIGFGSDQNFLKEQRHAEKNSRQLIRQ